MLRCLGIKSDKAAWGLFFGVSPAADELLSSRRRDHLVPLGGLFLIYLFSKPVLFHILNFGYVSNIGNLYDGILFIYLFGV